MENKNKITKENFNLFFDFFEKKVLVKNNLTINEKVNLFIQITINPLNFYDFNEDSGKLKENFFGEVFINKKNFRLIFSNLEYSKKEKDDLVSNLDRLVEDSVRRNRGEFFTPTIFCELAHKYISDSFGLDWKDRFIVWDCAWGTGNLTRDFEFKNLYASTIEQSDIDTSNKMNYNPEAIKFRFDFLNDSDDFLPKSLIDSIESGKEILFLINPPYATETNIKGSNKDGDFKSLMNLNMISEDWGKSSKNLYSQFLYRISKYQDINKNIKLAIFCPSLFLTGTSFKKFRNNFFNNFNFKNGFLFNSSHFSGVSTKGDWGINFSIFDSEPNSSKFLFDLIEVDNEFFLKKIGTKEIYNLDNEIPASKWIREEVRNLTPIETISFRNFLEISNGYRIYGRSTEKSLGYLFMGGNNIDTNPTNVSVYSAPYYNGHGVNIIEENFFKCCSLFSARKLIKKTWINSKDEYLKPNTEHHLYEQFEIDSIITLLFDVSSFQTSIRNVLYNGVFCDITNEFFWLSKDELIDLAINYNYINLYNDAKKSEERFVYKKLFKEGFYQKLSLDAKEVLDLATNLVKKTFEFRENFSLENPKYNLDSWDAGYAQLKLICKDFAKEEFDFFREKYRTFENRQRNLVYEIGFLKI